MRLKIENLAKISKADIVIDGVTVIAGDNNTGKSTVGKVLDSVFNSSLGMEDKMETARIKLLADRLQKTIEQNIVYNSNGNSRSYGYPRAWYLNLSRRLLAVNDKEQLNLLGGICEKLFDDKKDGEHTNIINLMREQIWDIQRITENSLCENIYTNYFNEVFNNQINSVFSDKEANIILTIKGKRIELSFQKNKCLKAESNINILNSSVYLDDPFVLDELNNQNDRFLYSGFNHLQINKRNLCKKLIGNMSDEIEDSSLKQLLTNNKLQEVLPILNKVVSGNVVKKQHYMYSLPEAESEPLDLNSLSAGLKSFVILKQLLMNGSLQDKDVVVLDEPEIHLHPEWQLIYAEIIVILQKVFDFSIVVTTHSSHFMEALELYSKKYGVGDKCHYYIARLQEGEAVFEEVSHDLSKIYKQMVMPVMDLEKLREELELEDD